MGGASAAPRAGGTPFVGAWTKYRAMVLPHSGGLTEKTVQCRLFQGDEPCCRCLGSRRVRENVRNDHPGHDKTEKGENACGPEHSSALGGGNGSDEGVERPRPSDADDDTPDETTVHVVGPFFLLSLQT